MKLRTLSVLLISVLLPAIAMAGKPTVHLTFDDGPNPNTTPRLLNLLKQRGIKATFFVTGAAANANPALLKRIVMEGHSLGNHTWNHPDLSRQSAAKVREELAGTQWAVDTALGVKDGKHFPMRLMRPPYGAKNQTVKDIVDSMLTPAGAALQAKGKLPEGAGRTKLTLWNVDSNDWQKKGTAWTLGQVFPAVDGNAGDHKVLLMHDIHATTVNEYAPAIIDRLVNEGYKFERLDKVKGYIGTPR